MIADTQLLRDYTEGKSQDAFTALVHRHLNLVYSAALRQVPSPQLAEEISQSVFIDLARAADKLKTDTVLTAWLYQVTRRTAIDVIRRESRRQARERLAVEMAAMNTTADWAHIEPLLDDAMETLHEPDRAAILLRYFENKSLRDVGQSLGISDDAAQKRVSRAVDRLREYFSKRGVAIGASGLVVVISINAVHAAPVSLTTTISTAAVLAGATAHASTAVTATKIIAMTTLQKTLVTATLAIAVGTGIYEAHQASQLRRQNETLLQRQKPLVEQIQQLQQERDEATARLGASSGENKNSNENNLELLKLRAEVSRLRILTNAPNSASNGKSLNPSDPLWEPNWQTLYPLDLSQFPDSTEKIISHSSKNVGIGTPAALLQTWIWAQRTSDRAGILRTWDFPDGTTDEQKMDRVEEALRDEEFARQHSDTIGNSEIAQLRDLFDLGDGYYLAFIYEKSPTIGPWVSHQLFRRVGDEWKVSTGRTLK
jgi:RNA polymerase sigma factor (sigma-70 family)